MTNSDLVEQLRAALGREAMLSAELQAAGEAADALLAAAREAGMPWSQLAAELGVPQHRLEWRMRRLTADERGRRSTPSKPPKRAGVAQPGLGPAGTVNVTEAAAALGVARSTIYTWIEEGRLEAVEASHTGRTRVTEESIERELGRGASDTLTAAEAATLLGAKSRTTVYQLLRAGHISKADGGGISRASVEAFMRQ